MSEETILIADSDLAFAEPLARFFTENELKPVILTPMTVALESLMQEHYDIAIIDFCDSGFREYIATAVQRRSNGTAVILTCSRPSAATERAARALSPAFYFVKPVEPNDLLAVIVRITEIKSRQEILAAQRMKKRKGARHEQAV